MEMTSRERVLTALNHQEPDRVPIHADFTPEAAEKLSKHLQLKDSVTEAYSGKVAELPLVLGHDLLVAWHGIATSYYAQKSEEYTCEWGINWRWVQYPHGRYTEMIQRPLEDEDKLASYKTPDPHESWRYDSARTLLRERGKSHVIVGGMPCTLFEAAWYLRGYETFLTDLKVNKDFANELLDKIFDFQLVTGTTLAKLGVDIIWVGDDFGTQDSMIMSPAVWREFFKSRYEKLIAEFKEIKPDVKIAYHSDGNIEAILPEYIEIGVDILNAVQPKSMNTAHLKRRFGDVLSFWGTVDIQEVLPYGTPEDVHNEVKLRIQSAGPKGGLIIAPSHNFQPDVPLINILAFYDAAKKFGTYPVV